MNYFEFQKKFQTEKTVIDYFVKIRYNDNVVCPKCSKTEGVYRRHTEPRKIHCNHCESEYSFFSGTIFEKSDTDLRKWFYAINLVILSRKGILASQLKREIGVTYKTAWRMLKQIRTAMGNKDMSKAFEAIVEIDETYVGGKPRKDNNYDLPKPPLKRGRGTNKTAVIGVKERNSERVYAQIALPNKDGKKLTGKQLFKVLDKVCKDNTTIITDDFSGYNFLDRNNVNNYVRLSVNHSAGQYVSSSGVHTNGIESFWALLKRGIYGIYHHISVKYMQRYVNEFTFRINDNSFDRLLKQCVLV
jgi:transposase-like protein